MAHRLSASEVALATRPSWTPDMPQMKAYKQRMHARLLQEGEQQKFPRSKAVADVALQPDQAATPQLGGCAPPHPPAASRPPSTNQLHRRPHNLLLSPPP